MYRIYIRYYQRLKILFPLIPESEDVRVLNREIKSNHRNFPHIWYLLYDFYLYCSFMTINRNNFVAHSYINIKSFFHSFGSLNKSISLSSIDLLYNMEVHSWQKKYILPFQIILFLMFHLFV